MADDISAAPALAPSAALLERQRLAPPTEVIFSPPSSSPRGRHHCRTSHVNVLCLGMSYADWGRSLPASTIINHDSEGEEDGQPPRRQQCQRIDGTRHGVATRDEESNGPDKDDDTGVTAAVAWSPPASRAGRWRDAVEAVGRGHLSEMDGRDLARCLAVEALEVDRQNENSPMGSSDAAAADKCRSLGAVRVYTSSQELGGTYRTDRHLHGNFCRRGWVRRLIEQFPDTQFDQVVLDYFWIPTGWDESHWTKPFFEQTLPDLCRHGVLRCPPGPDRLPAESVATGDISAAVPFPGTASPTSTMHIDAEKETLASSDNSQQRTAASAVYLPFTLHCFRMVLACRKVLLLHYDISFVRRNDLHEILLWKGTQDIDERYMQRVLGKQRDQEEVYCRPDSFVQTIQEQEESQHIASHELLDVARRVPQLHEVRFIALRPVAGAETNSSEGKTPTRTRRDTRSTPGQILGLLEERRAAPTSYSKATRGPPAKRALDFGSTHTGEASARHRSRIWEYPEGPEPAAASTERSPACAQGERLDTAVKSSANGGNYQGQDRNDLKPTHDEVVNALPPPSEPIVAATPRPETASAKRTLFGFSWLTRKPTRHALPTSTTSQGNSN